MANKQNITPKHPWHVYNERALHWLFLQRQRVVSVTL